MAKPVKFYFDLLSQPSRALFMFLEANKIPYEPIPVSLRKGENLKPEFKQINRFQKVPCINDDGFKLSESVAILRYLSREKLVPEHWYPKESKSQARIDEYLEWQHLNMRQAGTSLFRTKWIKPLVTGEQPDPKRVEAAVKSVNEALDQIENNWLQPSKYLVANKITIADLVAITEVEQTLVAGHDPCENRPKMTAWMKLVKETLDPHYENANQIIFKLTKKKELLAAKN